MKSVWRLVALAALGLIVAACQPAPPCDATLTRVPVPAGAADGSLIDSTNPVLRWTYPEACQPHEFQVEFWLNNSLRAAHNTTLGFATRHATVFLPVSNLTIGKPYMWRIAARNATFLGPWSKFRLFVFGPACEASELMAPTLVMPSSGSPVASTDPEYQWSHPSTTCAPEGYRLQISTQPNLGSPGFDEKLASAYTSFQTGADGFVLSDCTKYYWRVAATRGSAQGPWSAIGEFQVNATGNCPCLPAQLTEPTPLQPPAYSVVGSLTPLLDWSFSAQCEIDGFAVHLSPTFDMSDTSLFGGTGTPATAWTPAPLQPHTQYWWEVAAGVGTDFGPYSPLRSFFTGPECSSPAELVAPEPLSPPNGAHVTDGYAVLQYQPGTPGCIPDGYFLNLQTDSDFGGTNLLTEYDLPATNVITDPLADCTIYYWKVAAVQDGVRGPESAMRWFFTNQSGACPAPSFSAEVLQNLNCRSGASQVFPAKRVFLMGEIVEVLGRSRDMVYLVLKVPEGGHCWAPTSFVRPYFDVEKAEVWSLPPTPVPVTPTPVCTRQLTQDQCKAAGGTWRLDPNVLTAVVYYCDCSR